VLSKQSRTADKGPSLNLEVGEGLTTLTIKCSMLQNVKKRPEAPAKSVIKLSLPAKPLLR
jgi:hypothetical protein